MYKFNIIVVGYAWWHRPGPPPPPWMVITGLLLLATIPLAKYITDRDKIVQRDLEKDEHDVLFNANPCKNSYTREDGTIFLRSQDFRDSTGIEWQVSANKIRIRTNNNKNSITTVLFNDIYSITIDSEKISYSFFFEDEIIEGGSLAFNPVDIKIAQDVEVRILEYKKY